MMNEAKITETAKRLTDRCFFLSTDISFLATLKKTNTVWNNGNYQQIRVVGPMVEAFDSSKTPDLYEGILNYLKTGEYRSEMLTTDLAYFDDPDYLRIHGKKIVMNLIPGRSLTFLNRLVSSFAFSAQINEKDALNQVIYRLFYQTYKGVLFEHQTVSMYQAAFPTLTFEKTTPEKDSEYAIDYLIKQDGVLVAALQIKPISYHFPKSQAHKDQVTLNIQKNQSFLEAFGVGVAYAYYNDNIASLANVLSTNQAFKAN